MNDSELKSIILRLLPNISHEKIIIHPIFGGRNNRAYHVKCDDQAYFLKHYNINDGQNRLQSEYQFLEYAAHCGSKYTVRPIATDPKFFFALYEYKSGCRYQTENIQDNEINHALTFLYELNKFRFTDESKKLHDAREACFTLSAHIQCVDNRILNLEKIDIFDDIDRQALFFIEKKLKPAWLEIRESVFKKSNEFGLSLNGILSPEDRVISPSDFGFHNALKLPNDGILFVDFEYAGWDDPAKLIGDFFNQVEVPISFEYLTYFSDAISKYVKNPHEMLIRTRLLFPVYSIKWCCIILNYFLPKSKIYKSFSTDITQSVRREQLNKAKKNLDFLMKHVIADRIQTN